MKNIAFTLVMMPPQSDIRRGWAETVARADVGVRVLQPETLEEVVLRYRQAARAAGAELDDCIITKQDEAGRLAPVLESNADDITCLVVFLGGDNPQLAAIDVVNDDHEKDLRPSIVVFPYY